MIRRIIDKVQKFKPKNKILLNPVQKFNDKSLNIYGIQIIFLVIALLYASLLLFNKGIQYRDVLFHFLRLKDVDLEIIHGQFPQFNFYTNMPIGNAINTFYPYILLLPFSLLMIFFKGTTILSIIIFSVVFISLEVCYYCFHHILNFSVYSSFLISLFQWVSSLGMSTILIQSDYGETLSTIFIPLIFTGWIMWIEHGKWKMMIFGICGTTLSNIPMACIMLFILMMLTIMQWKRLTIHKIYIGIKATIISVLILAGYWLPIIVLRATNQIYLPNQINIKSWKDSLWPTSLAKAFTPMGYTLWDLLELLAVILVIIEWKHLSTFIKQITVLSIGLILMNIQIFGIQHFLEVYTPIKLIQFTQRFNLITHFLLIITLIYCLDIVYTQIKHKTLLVNLCYPEIIIYICLLSLIGIINCESDYNAKPLSNQINTITTRDAGEKLSLTNRRGNHVYTHTTPTTLHTVDTSAQCPDYLPVSVLNNHIRNQMPYKTGHYYNNGMNFREIHKRQLLLPITIYHSQKYYITDNNKPIHYKYHHHYIKLNLHSGENRIRVKAPIMWYRYVGMILSLIGLGFVCYQHKGNSNDKVFNKKASKSKAKR